MKYIVMGLLNEAFPAFYYVRDGYNSSDRKKATIFSSKHEAEKIAAERQKVNDDFVAESGKNQWRTVYETVEI